MTISLANGDDNNNRLVELRANANTCIRHSVSNKIFNITERNNINGIQHKDRR